MTKPQSAQKLRPWSVAYLIVVVAGGLLVLGAVAPGVAWYLWMMNSFLPFTELAKGYGLIAVALFEIGVPIWLAAKWRHLTPVRRNAAIVVWCGILILALAILDASQRG